MPQAAPFTKQPKDNMSKEEKGLSRRKFVQASGIMAAAAVINPELKANAATFNPPAKGEDYLTYIDPLIGNIAPLLNTNRPVG